MRAKIDKKICIDLVWREEKDLHRLIKILLEKVKNGVEEYEHNIAYRNNPIRLKFSQRFLINRDYEEKKENDKLIHLVKSRA